MPLYRFADCLLDTERRTLSLGGEPVEIQPLILELLTYFVQHPGRVIGRDELLRAVWRSPVVTGSVVASAVMKARRAIGDDAAAPKHICTAARAGYRFDAQVEVTEAKAAYRLAVLPFRDERDGADSAWSNSGLTQLSGHLAAGHGQINVVPPADVLSLQLGDQGGLDRIEQACRLLGAQEALDCRIERTQDGLALQVRRGASTTAAQTQLYRGNDPVELTRRMMADLIVQLGGTAPDWSAEAVWHRQFAHAMSLEQQGQFKQALDTLNLALPHLDCTPAVRLLRAKLLRRCGRRQDARHELDTALADAAAAHGSLVRIELLLESAPCRLDAGDVPGALRECRDGLQLAAEHPDGRSLMSSLLAVQASVLLRAGDGDAAVESAQRSLSQAVAVGSAVLEGRARLRLASVLLYLERLDQAAEAATRAVAHTHHSGLPPLELEALRLLGTLEVAQRHFSACDRILQQAAELCAISGDVQMLQSVRFLSAAALIEADRLHEGEQRLSLLGNPEDLVHSLSEGVQILQAALDWKQGRRKDSVGRLEALVARAGTAASNWANNAAFYLLLAEVDCERFNNARTLLDNRVRHDPKRARVALAEAALALAQGQRPLAISILRSFWVASPGGSGDAMDCCISLAWLLLEDEDPRAPSAPLDALAATLLDYAPEYLAVRVFRAAYLLRRSPTPETIGAWDSLVLQVRPLQRNCPWTARADYRDALAAGTSKRLRQLLIRACF